MEARRMNEDEHPAQVTRPAAEIERLSATFDLSRKVAAAAIAVLVMIGLGLVAVTVGSLGFDPVAVGAVATAVLIGVVFLVWHRHTMRSYSNLLHIIETQQTKPDQHDLPPGESR